MLGEMVCSNKEHCVVQRRRGSNVWAASMMVVDVQLRAQSVVDSMESNSGEPRPRFPSATPRVNRLAVTGTEPRGEESVNSARLWQVQARVAGVQKVAWVAGPGNADRCRRPDNELPPLGR